MGLVRSILRFLTRYHFYGSVAIALLVALAMAVRVTDRYHFASNELYEDVTQRWGAPIVQPVPSVRFVEAGSVFNRLESLPFQRQTVRVEADMSYRKRGLVYFSGFEFGFDGRYQIANDQGKAIDLVFVYPLQMVMDQVLLSDLVFRVDGEEVSAVADEDRGRLQWTGRLQAGEELDIHISMRGRGLDSFTYRLDPALPVRDFSFEMAIRGGDGYDYAAGVLPAGEVREADGATVLAWTYDSLESGVAVGAVLPSVKAYDEIILQMIRHGVVAFLLFFASTVAAFERFGWRPRFYQSYLLAATWAFFFVLLPYLGAFLHFYLAYALSLIVVVSLIFRFLVGLLGKEATKTVLGIVFCSLVVPTFAVLLRGYTGLVYTLEILVLLGLLLQRARKPEVIEAVDRALGSLVPKSPLAANPQSTEEGHV